MIISTDAEKTFDKNTTSFHNKNPQQIGYRENAAQHNKGSYIKTAQLTSNSIVKS